MAAAIPTYAANAATAAIRRKPSLMGLGKFPRPVSAPAAMSLTPRAPDPPAAHPPRPRRPIALRSSALALTAPGHDRGKSADNDPGRPAFDPPPTARAAAGARNTE